MRIPVFIFCFLFSISLSAQKLDRNQLEALTEKQWQPALKLLNEIVAMPNDAVFPEQIEVNIKWCEQVFAARGWTQERLETGGIPLLLLEKKQPNSKKTALFYFHVDGQAVDISKWDQPNAYEPVLKTQAASGNWEVLPMERLQTEYNPDWRIFGRSTSDDKGPLAMFIAAWDALAEAGLSPDYSVKIILDFEEEQGSPLLPAAVVKYKGKLNADLMLIMDGPRHTSNLPTLSYGARGISDLFLTTYGAKLPQHSGHYGNYAPNPALLMSQLLSSMKDENGRVVIPGFYDGITFTEAERKIFAAVPDNEPEVKKRLGISRTDQVGQSYQESINYPSLNIRGMSAGYTGSQSTTIIPSIALAELDMRLVPESDPVRLLGLIKDHIRNQGFYITETDPTDEERMTYPKIVKVSSTISYQAFRTPMDSPTGAWLRKAMNRAFGEDPVQIRISGGSIPISPFVDALGIPAVTIPTVNADNNQHSPNENLRLGNYKEGILTIMSILNESMY
ncbi:M20/M25/M40 family metallo-hydrolase [Algoriphagus sp.]|uniref:M20/M25/M40 family metallo-hydrolase n=1 Tax=Algoriphagus sp. TaxID=1872435 RepID=UPI00391D9706